MRASDKPIVVSRDALEPLFDRPLRQAAQSLHISATALKSICRKLKVGPRCTLLFIDHTLRTIDFIWWTPARRAQCQCVPRIHSYLATCPSVVVV